ncbi:hypothetical protein J6W91_03100 [Candidatus Saccharibacteria bacterium]|nr:hypothetical protein [Candidatus Saccharibacteria bacterium]
MTEKNTKMTFVFNDSIIFDLEEVIFAEFAEPGAMGAAGTVNVFALQNGKLKHYSANVKDGDGVYDNIFKMLRNCAENGWLDYSYGGYGNIAFKKKDIKFERDDDKSTLIYKDGRKRHKIVTTNFGVYSSIIHDFAEQPAPLDIMKECLDKKLRPLEDADEAFIRCYIEAAEGFEKGHIRIETDLSDYNDAISLIKFNHGENVEDYKVEEYWPYGNSAIQKYRLKYVIEKIGWMKLHKFMNKFFKQKRNDFFAMLDDELGEKQKISEKFMKIRNGKYDGRNVESLAELFKYPTIINFDKETRKTINQKIMTDVNLNAESDDVSFYLLNYFWHLFDWGFEEIEPVAWYIVDNCPTNDFNGTHTDKLFWVATHILNTHWKRLTGTKKAVFEEKIIEHFFPRVGGLWPIFHFNEFELNEKTHAYIMFESIGFIVSCDPEAWEYLPSGLRDFLMTETALHSNHPAVKHFAEKMQGKNPEDA